jgi:hypothetical protein
MAPSGRATGSLTASSMPRGSVSSSLWLMLSSRMQMKDASWQVLKRLPRPIQMPLRSFAGSAGSSFTQEVKKESRYGYGCDGEKCLLVHDAFFKG